MIEFFGLIVCLRDNICEFDFALFCVMIKAKAMIDVADLRLLL